MQNQCCSQTNSTITNQRVRVIGFIIIAAIMLYAGYGIELTYFKLHFFVLLPFFGLLFLPPMPLKHEPREIKVIGYSFPFIIAVCAIIFSSFWDNYIASKGVWTFDRAKMVGVIGHIPLEEYFWFVDHTLLSSCFVLHLWGTRTPQPLPPSDYSGTKIRITGTVILLILMASGLWLLQFDKMLFVGVTLAYFAGFICFMWIICGHLILQQKRELLMSISLVSLYVLLIDAWAVNEGVWAFGSKYMTGIKLFGITDWSQIMIYCWATAIVVIPMLAVLRMTEILVSRMDKEAKSNIFVKLIKALLKRTS